MFQSSSGARICHSIGGGDRSNAKIISLCCSFCSVWKRKLKITRLEPKLALKSRLTSIPVFYCSDKRVLRNKSENLIVLSDESIPIPLILSKQNGVENQTINLNYWLLGGRNDNIASSNFRSTTTIVICFMQVISDGSG